MVLVGCCVFYLFGVAIYVVRMPSGCVSHHRNLVVSKDITSGKHGLVVYMNGQAKQKYKKHTPVDTYELFQITN